MASCTVVKEETYMKNQITYKEKKSWRKVSMYEEEREKTPKRLIQTTTVIIDTTKKIKYITIEKLKKDTLGYYFHTDHKEKVMKISKKESKFIASGYYLSGSFKPNYLKEGDKFKLEFNSDGTCIYKWKSYCGDSPCFTDRMSKGIYKIYNDSVFIYFYLGKTQTFYYIKNKTVANSIEKARWDVISTYNMNFIFNKTHDTLKLINQRGNIIRNNNVFTPADSTKIIFGKNKSEAELKVEKERKKAEYESYLKQGDKLFNEENFDQAYYYYVEALKIKPADILAKQRITEIKQLQQKEIEKQEINYLKIIKKADEYFESKEYEQAKELYEKARRIKPSEQYPLDRIALIDQVLNKK